MPCGPGTRPRELGPERFGQEVAAKDRGRGRGRNGYGNGNGNGGGGVQGQGMAGPPRGREAVAVPVAASAPSNATVEEVVEIPKVSPLRGGQLEGTLKVIIGSTEDLDAEAAAAMPPPDAWLGDMPPLEPLAGPEEPAVFAALGAESSDAPPLPDEARAVVARAAVATTTQLEAGPDQVLHIRFGSASSERIVAAFGELKSLIKSRPGNTPVVLHIPAGGGREQEMRLGVRIAYDAELVAQVQRTFEGLLQLQLA